MGTPVECNANGVGGTKGKGLGMSTGWGEGYKNWVRSRRCGLREFYE